MNKKELLFAIEVKNKHPWAISQEKYTSLFGDLPLEYIEEKLLYDNLLIKSKQFKKCQLILTQVKIEIVLTLDECIRWELNLDKWEEARSHNILPGDIKKII
jgi:hypothetical protein